MLSLYQEACKYIPGGVNFAGPCVFAASAASPFFFKKATGSAVTAADGAQLQSTTSAPGVR